jgi:hypothetical protein
MDDPTRTMVNSITTESYECGGTAFIWRVWHLTFLPWKRVEANSSGPLTQMILILIFIKDHITVAFSAEVTHLVVAKFSPWPSNHSKSRHKL